jgi:hypothetical protein
MSDAGTQPTVEQMAQAVYDFAADELAGGATASEVRGMLRQRGLDGNTAAHIVASFTNTGSAERKAGVRSMLFGAMWCIGGTVVTVATYGAAQEGGRYVIAYGAIIAGVAQFFRGLIQVSNAK